jgi:hypothetical protein
MDPQGAVLGRVLTRESETRDLRVVGVMIRGAEFLEQRKRAGRLVGGADIEQAREMGEVIRHGDLLNVKTRPRGRALD